MQNGTAPAARDNALDRIEQAVFDINNEYVAEHAGSPEPIDHLIVFTNGDTAGFVFAELYRGDDRPLNSDELIGMWRDRVGEIAGMKELTFSGGDNIGDARFRNLTDLYFDAAERTLYVVDSGNNRILSVEF